MQGLVQAQGSSCYCYAMLCYAMLCYVVVRNPVSLKLVAQLFLVEQQSNTKLNVCTAPSIWRAPLALYPEL